ncbi:MAG: aspartate aminotransferase family protein [Tenericutes bacterium HGW-Tenericutes-6]|jgi:predicted acetylornithine/succinylornithine family transaminase|nr:MAG: aspartate aminotransferase family protein [Tenericutes bacterium HGW-Tenericutes-6]
MNVYELDQAYVLNTYKRLPLVIKKAKGSFLIDENNHKYLDMYAGIAVSSLGHQHPAIQKAIKTQMKKHLHLSNYFATHSTSALAKMLVEKSFASKVFFTNSGTEAIEASIKLVRKWGKSIHNDKIELIALDQSFHGRTIGGLSLTGQPKYQEAFKPLLPGIKHVKRNDITAIKSAINEHTCAIYLEMIQGESGVEPLSQDFVDALIELRKKHQFLIVVDEIQTGLLRTGKLFAYEHYGLVPDILTLAKSLGGGIPLGAMLVSKPLENVFVPGDHGSTFGGNPLATAMGLSTLEILSDPKMIASVTTKSNFLLGALLKLKETYPFIHEVRGKGLMIGIDVGKHAKTIQDEALKRHVLLNVTNVSVIRLLPPLTISKAEIEMFLRVFEAILKTLSE